MIHLVPRCGVGVLDAHVLVVEDEEELRTVVADALRDEGFAVETARHGQEALARVQAGPPDVILLDMRMPVMNGWEFVSAYRQQVASPAPIVVMTAARNALEWCREVQAQGCLPKPFDLDAMFEIVERLAGDIAG